MPYYKWNGIDLDGKIRNGVLFASSYDQLATSLLKQDVALLDVAVSRKRKKKDEHITIACGQVVALLQQIGVLVRTGIFLSDALHVLASQTKSEKVKNLVERLSVQVQGGSSFSQALELFPKVFNTLIITAVKAGESSGDLGKALERLCIHLENKEKFYKKVRSASLMPLITLLFFFSITSFIIMFIVPHFITIMQAHNTVMPWSTRLLVRCSELMNATSFLPLIGLIGVLFMMIRLFRSNQLLAYKVDMIVISLPFIRKLTIHMTLMYFFESLSLLLEGDVPLVNALSIAVQSVDNSVIKRHIKDLIVQVETGSSLSEACQDGPSWLFGNDIITMISVGQESGKLKTMIQRSAFVYEGRVKHALSLFITLIQPTLMIILGLLVASLIVAIYVPIFTVSDSVGGMGF